jgi:carbon monoxide dehydrogenase subunit G
MKSYKQIVTIAMLSFAFLVFMQVTSQAQAAAPAQAAPAAATAQGELVEVDAKASTLSVKTATADMKFTYNEQTKVTGAQKGVAGLATMAGSQVTVQYHKEGAANIATSIEVRPKQ